MTPTDLRIRVRNDVAVMPGTIRPLVATELSVALGEYALDARGQLACATSPAEFFGVRPRGALDTWVGLVPRICRTLRRHGITHEIVGRDHLYRQRRAQYLRVGLGRETASQWARYRGGQFVVDSFADSLAHIETLCSWWPKDQILVVCANNDRSYDVHCHLAQRLTRPVVVYAERTPGCVSTCTLHELPSWRYWGVVIFHGVEAVVAPSNLSIIAANLGQVRYCVRRADRPLDLYGQLLLELACGPVFWTSEPDPRHIEVAFARAHAMHAARYESALSRKRSLIWHNANRNQVIADIARAVVAGNVTTLYEHGLFLTLEGSQVHDLLGDRQPAILVESVEHARALQRLLPDWPVAAIVQNADGYVDLPEQRTIVTMGLLHDVGCTSSVIIRADGTSSSLDRISSPTQSSYRLVIDMDDAELDAQARADTQSRRNQYDQLGWHLHRAWTTRHLAGGQLSRPR